MRQSPYWAEGERLVPTLAYDAAVMGDGAPPPLLRRGPGPHAGAGRGRSSPEWMRASPRGRPRRRSPGARFEVLEGQTHDVAADVLAAAVGELA